MLELDNPEWSDLDHAYGPATDIPDLLRELRDFPPAAENTAEPYFSLWSSLCHQGSVYMASFAAVPHIVEACQDEPEIAHWSAAQLVVCIEIARLRLIMPESFKLYEKEYRRAIANLPEAVAEMQKQNPDPETEIILKAAIEVANGNDEDAEKILDGKA
jgi:hypothetical protein